MSVYQTTFADKKIETSIEKEIVPLPELVKRIRARMMERGSAGIRGMGRVFRIMDDDGNKRLNYREFSAALSDMGVVVNRAEFNLLTKFLDKNADGNIDFDEFLQGLRGEMNETRIAIVRKAYEKMDVDGSGLVDMNDIRGTYAADSHPAVLAGEKDEEEVLLEFIKGFEGTENPDGKVEWPEFKAYYNKISASVDNDEHFVDMITNAWKL